MVKKISNLSLQEQIIGIVMLTLVFFVAIEISQHDTTITTFEETLIPEIVALAEISQTTAMILSKTNEYVTDTSEDTLDDLDVYKTELSLLMKDFESTYPETARQGSYIATRVIIGELLKTQEAIIQSHSLTRETLEYIEELEEDMINISEQVNDAPVATTGIESISAMKDIIALFFSVERETFEYVTNPKSDALNWIGKTAPVSVALTGAESVLESLVTADGHHDQSADYLGVKVGGFLRHPFPSASHSFLILHTGRIHQKHQLISIFQTIQ